MPRRLGSTNGDLKPTVGRPTPPVGPPIKAGLAQSAPLTGGVPPMTAPVPLRGQKPATTPAIGSTPRQRPGIARRTAPGFSAPGTGPLDNETSPIARPAPATAPPRPMNPSPLPEPPRTPRGANTKLRVGKVRGGGGPMGFNPTGV